MLEEATVHGHVHEHVNVHDPLEERQNFIILVNIDTMRSRRSIPSFKVSGAIGLKAAQASRIDPHSMAEPLAMPKYRDLSASLGFPTPSAIFCGIDTDARLSSSDKKEYPRGILATIVATKARN